MLNRRPVEKVPSSEPAEEPPRAGPSGEPPSAPTDSEQAARRGRGRRAGGSTAREDVLRAARSEFAEHGYAGTTIRAVATTAGVDPALIHYFFGTKDGLFAAAMALPANPAELLSEALAGGPEAVGERLVRRALELWDAPTTRSPLLALIRSASSHAAAATLRGFVEDEMVPRLAAVASEPDPSLRASLAGSTLAGLIVARYVLGVEPLASARREEVTTWVGPTLQRYLTGNAVERPR